MTKKKVDDASGGTEPTEAPSGSLIADTTPPVSSEGDGTPVTAVAEVAEAAPVADAPAGEPGVLPDDLLPAGDEGAAPEAEAAPDVPALESAPEAESEPEPIAPPEAQVQAPASPRVQRANS